MKSVIGSEMILFVGGHYEIKNPGSGQEVTKYYFAGAQRVAMRKGSTLSYLLGDHLGSTSLTTNTSGTLVSELRYKPWGETRYTSGTMPTQYQFTGQRNEVSIGLYFYNARWYDSLTGRFAQADSIIPPTQGVQAWDRYAYTNNNPVRYTDPSGHCLGLAIVGCIVVVATVVTIATLVIAPLFHGTRWDPEDPSTIINLTPNDPRKLLFPNTPTITNTPPPPDNCTFAEPCVKPQDTPTPTISPTPTLIDPCNGAEYCWVAPPTATTSPTPTLLPSPTPTLHPLPTVDLSCAVNWEKCTTPVIPTSTSTQTAPLWQPEWRIPVITKHEAR